MERSFSVESLVLFDVSRNMDCVIDIQGFKNNEKKFIIKEASVLMLSENTFGHWIVSPPSPFNDLPLSAQVYNDIQTKYRHGIEWFDGDIQSRKLHANLREITRKMSIIYVHGDENTQFIENLIARKVINLQHLGCKAAYTFNNEKTMCNNHALLLNRAI